MNGTIDLSSSNTDLSRTGMGRDVLEYDEDDDSSWSETSESWSCSSGGTCYTCDICNDAEFCQNVGSRNKITYPEREFPSSVKPSLTSFQKDQHRLRSIKNEDTYETRKELLCPSRSSNKNMYSSNNISGRGCSTASRILDTNFVTYSSGSDKEVNSSISSSMSSSILKNTDSSSEISSNENFTGLLPSNTERRTKFVKRVTFSDTCSRGKQCRSFKGSLSSVMPNPVSTVSVNENHNTEVSSECRRLQIVVKNTDPFLLRSLLLDQLQKQDSRTIATLSKLFPKTNYPLATIHCVRCHHDYSQSSGKQHCKVQHPIQAITRLCQIDQLACYTCGVCKKEYWVNILEDDKSLVINHLGYCFVGTHSPNVDDVSYYPQGAAKSCEDMGCIEFYV